MVGMERQAIRRPTSQKYFADTFVTALRERLIRRLSDMFLWLAVTSRVIVDALGEEFRPLALPVLEGGDMRPALQG